LRPRSKKEASPQTKEISAALNELARERRRRARGRQ
jgi:hypothetical protein